jgi:hypothetical protein
VVTRNKSYAARDMPAFLAAAGLPQYMVRLYETRDIPVALSLRAPLVPVTCVNGVGVPTPEMLVYRDGLDAGVSFNALTCYGTDQCAGMSHMIQYETQTNLRISIAWFHLIEPLMAKPIN